MSKYARQWFRPECETEQHAYIDVMEAEGYVLLTSYVYEEKLYLVMRRRSSGSKTPGERFIPELSTEGKLSLVRNNPDARFLIHIAGSVYHSNAFVTESEWIRFDQGIVHPAHISLIQVLE